MNELNLQQRIQSVSNDIKTIDKDMTVGFGKNSYKAVSDILVTKRVKESEKKHGLVSIPYDQEIISHETIKTIKDGSECIKFSFIIKMTTRIYRIDKPEEFIDIVTFGHGLDSGDKGFGKASTYARKSALLNAYKIATGEDDPDKEPSEQLKAPTTPSEKRIAVYNYLYTDNQRFQQVLTRFSVQSLDEISDKDMGIIYSGFHKKGVL